MDAPPARGEPAPPARVDVQWCIGCGAIDRFTDCPGDCAEVRLDLVPADEDRALVARLDALREELTVLRGVLEAFAAAAIPVAGEEGEAAYREHRSAARQALRGRAPDPADPPQDASVTTWWHPACGRVEAPAPCIGVCVRRPVELVPAGPYRANLAGGAELAARTAALRAVVRQLAWSTPRPEAWERGWAALAVRARAALAQGSTSPRRIA